MNQRMARCTSSTKSGGGTTHQCETHRPILCLADMAHPGPLSPSRRPYRGSITGTALRMQSEGAVLTAGEYSTGGGDQARPGSL